MAASWLGLSGLLLLGWAFVQPAHAAPCRPIDSPTATEERLQGRWEAYVYGTSSKAWTISFGQRRFRAEGEAGDWYRGRVEVRDKIEPSELDFIIEDCGCNYKGMTSHAIFRWEGESLVMAAPEPGAARPHGFVESSGEMMELRRVEDAGRTRPQN